MEKRQKKKLKWATKPSPALYPRGQSWDLTKRVACEIKKAKQVWTEIHSLIRYRGLARSGPPPLRWGTVWKGSSPILDVSHHGLGWIEGFFFIRCMVQIQSQSQLEGLSIKHEVDLGLDAWRGFGWCTFHYCNGRRRRRRPIHLFIHPFIHVFIQLITQPLIHPSILVKGGSNSLLLFPSTILERSGLCIVLLL